MSSFNFTKIIEFKNLIFDNKIFLWILHADKKPPHIAISINNIYYSLKVNGKDEIDISKILNLIDKKKISTILVEIIGVENAFEKFTKINKKYQKVSNKITCIAPINEFINNKVELVILPELLDKLKAENKIHQYYGLYLSQYDNFIISYDYNVVNDRVNKLLDK